jgi:succinyl-CoA:(S)-malate CoA-transferase subunit A/succinyl-CoA:(S)-malate CoA-transferase subunit B
MNTIPDNRPLAGLKVLDLATFIAAPVAAGILGEFGAEVLKVEKPGEGDPLRRLGSPSGRAGDSLYWMSDARNRRSITLDLRKPKGAALLRHLVKDTDVVVENFRPGTLEKWGLGYDVLAAENPGLVLLRLTAYGQSGPMANRVGFARMAHAMSGVGFLAGDPDRPPSNPGPASLADYVSAVYGAMGVMMALKARERDGKGQVVDVALYETMFRTLDECLPAYMKWGKVRTRTGSRTSNAAPNANFPTKDGHWVSITTADERGFERIAAAMGRPELARDPRFATMTARLANRDEIEGMIADWTASLDRDDVLAICEKADASCMAVLSIADIATHPQFLAREMFARVRDKDAGELVLPNVVPKLSRTPGRVDAPGPVLGEANADIYRGRLGLGAVEFEALKEEGVI